MCNDLYLFFVQPEPPSIRKDLQTVEAVKGASAQLECEVTGTTPFEISWLKNKKVITTDQKYKIVSQDALSRLEIKSFESADVGDYQCVISNDVGKVTAKAQAKLRGQSTVVKLPKMLLSISVVVIKLTKMTQ